MRRPRCRGVSRLNSHAEGVRLTEQRRAILQVIETAKRHLDAACILRLAPRINAAVARSTVYRTLHLLKHHGLIDELDLVHLERERHYYERQHEKEHVHMACIRCGRITEFVSELFDTVKNQLRRDCQYHIVVEGWKSEDAAQGVGVSSGGRLSGLSRATPICLTRDPYASLKRILGFRCQF